MGLVTFGTPLPEEVCSSLLMTSLTGLPPPGHKLRNPTNERNPAYCESDVAHNRRQNVKEELGWLHALLMSRAGYS